MNNCISVFKSKIRGVGPYYICSVCNRILYRKTVICLKKDKYNIQNLLTDVKSFDGKQYICKTCHSKASQGKVPSQAVCNKLAVDKIPQELLVLEKLEQILISQRIVFEKILVMPKGQQRKIKDAICNVPVDCDENCNNLPRLPERSGIIMLKRKRKFEFKGHVYFQAVRPQMILHALNWLRINNPLYSNINIYLSNIDNALILQQDQIIPDSNASYCNEGENPTNESTINNKVNNCNCSEPNSEVKPIYLFVTGGAGTGKSHLIKTLYHNVSKTFKCAPVNPEILNRFRTATHSEDIKCIQSRAIDPSDNNYPSEVLHIWKENQPVHQHNQLKLQQISSKMFHLKTFRICLNKMLKEF